MTLRSRRLIFRKRPTSLARSVTGEEALAPVALKDVLPSGRSCESVNQRLVDVGGGCRHDPDRQVAHPWLKDPHACTLRNPDRPSRPLRSANPSVSHALTHAEPDSSRTP